MFCSQNELNIVADGEVTLDTFCEYQQTINPVGDDNPLHFDYAILITGYVLKYNLCINLHTCIHTYYVYIIIPTYISRDILYNYIVIYVLSLKT